MVIWNDTHGHRLYACMCTLHQYVVLMMLGRLHSVTKRAIATFLQLTVSVNELYNCIVVYRNHFSNALGYVCTLYTFPEYKAKVHAIIYLILL